ncbi:hypothetical protein BpHYR1_037382 [Brachionus plicatilis]|uniref:Uncharacterized protein n=1 Tax=Brachionus plicatilis TaxID=10195 RepID=A0A3M7QHS1_BRAPC|nr:hypothetical protein BpHYR1_037382 [Brachionus plicatilis]
MDEMVKNESLFRYFFRTLTRTTDLAELYAIIYSGVTISEKKNFVNFYVNCRFRYRLFLKKFSLFSLKFRFFGHFGFYYFLTIFYEKYTKFTYRNTTVDLLVFPVNSNLKILKRFRYFKQRRRQIEVNDQMILILNIYFLTMNFKTVPLWNELPPEVTSAPTIFMKVEIIIYFIPFFLYLMNGYYIKLQHCNTK